jgi:2-oxoglutarate/2-oxoacid ferredoxin oxidoreductase subunit beta
LSVVDVFQPCVTWNHLNTFQWFRERVYKLEETDWDPTNRSAAFDLSMTTFHELTCTPETCKIPIGVYYERSGVASYEDEVPASAEPGWTRALAPRDVSAIMAELG